MDKTEVKEGIWSHPLAKDPRVLIKLEDGDHEGHAEVVFLGDGVGVACHTTNGNHTVAVTFHPASAVAFFEEVLKRAKAHLENFQ